MQGRCSLLHSTCPLEIFKFIRFFCTDYLPGPFMANSGTPSWSLFKCHLLNKFFLTTLTIQHLAHSFPRILASLFILPICFTPFFLLLPHQWGCEAANTYFSQLWKLGSPSPKLVGIQCLGRACSLVTAGHLPVTSYGSSLGLFYKDFNFFMSPVT